MYSLMALTGTTISFVATDRDQDVLKKVQERFKLNINATARAKPERRARGYRGGCRARAAHPPA